MPRYIVTRHQGRDPDREFVVGFFEEESPYEVLMCMEHLFIDNYYSVVEVVGTPKTFYHREDVQYIKTRVLIPKDN